MSGIHVAHLLVQYFPLLHTHSFLCYLANNEIKRVLGHSQLHYLPDKNLGHCFDRKPTLVSIFTFACAKPFCWFSVGPFLKLVEHKDPQSRTDFKVATM